MAIVLRGGAVLTVNGADEFLPAADIRIEGDTISAIGAAGSLARPGDTLIDCSEALIAPGLVNVHTHAATAFYRGMAEDRPREFWSAGYAMPGQERFTVEDHVFSVRAACAEFLLNGVTCIADRLGNMDRIAPGHRGVGHPRRRRPFAGRRQGAGRLEDRPRRARTLRHRSPPPRLRRHRPACPRHLLR